MTTLGNKKLHKWSLAFVNGDTELEKLYQKRKNEIIHKNSHALVLSKFIYGLYLIKQTITEEVPKERMISYLCGVFLHLILAQVLKQNPSYQMYNSTVCIITFCSFLLNDPRHYRELEGTPGTDCMYNRCPEHVALIIGFVAISYLSTTFLTWSWLHCALGQLIATINVIYFYWQGLNHHIDKIAPALILCSISCAVNAYQIEMQEKNEFLEKIQNETL